MLAKYRNIIIGVGGFIVFLFLVQMIFVKSLKVPDFTYETYESRQIAFNTCYGEGLEQKQNEIEAYLTKHKQTKDAKDIQQNSLELLQQTSCNVSFVSNNDGQIRDMAEEVLAYVQTFYNEKDVKMLNTVYTTDEQFSAILQQPRSYLFFGLTSDEKTMVGFLATPQKDGTISIEPQWDKENGSNDAYTQNEVSKLLFIYNQKIF